MCCLALEIDQVLPHLFRLGQYLFV